jgi:hypothetical protein
MPGPERAAADDRELYALYDELDRLEELLEDMRDLGVASSEDAERRLADLNDRIDERESAATP